MRYIRLDGLRGLLSLIVALNHSFMIVAIPVFAGIWGQNILEFYTLQSKLQQIFMLIGNGGLAVSLFFVLSGFVLAKSSTNWNFSLPSSLVFYARRFLRLYPVYFFLILVSALYMWSGFEYKLFPAGSPWFHWWMNFDMTFKEFILNATFIHTYIGGVTWTLRVILLASLTFPPLFLLSKKLNLSANLFVFSLLAWASFDLLDFPNFNDLRFTYMFYLGMLIPKMEQFFESIPPKLIAVIILPLTFIALYFRYLFEIHLAGLVESIFSFFLLGILSYSKSDVFRFLESSLFRFLGKISYSLYLVHFTVLYICGRFVLAYLPSSFLTANYFAVHSLIFVFTTLLAIGLSVLVNRFIETPAQELSRKIKAG